MAEEQKSDQGGFYPEGFGEESKKISCFTDGEHDLGMDGRCVYCGQEVSSEKKLTPDGKAWAQASLRSATDGTCPKDGC